jgi:hypothetical protein
MRAAGYNVVALPLAVGILAPLDLASAPFTKPVIMKYALRRSEVRTH